MDLEAAVRARTSVKAYEPHHELSDEVLRCLFGLVVRSPSSFNLQHWRFIVVRDAERRQRLMQASFHQSQVGEASATVVVGARLAAHEDAERVYADAPEEVRAKLVPMIAGLYRDKPQLQRDEAIRSGSLAAMTLMLAATSMGLATCPMIGFDPGQVTELAGLDEGTIPVMLITLGKARGPVRPSERLPLGEVVRLETLDGPPLG